MLANHRPTLFANDSPAAPAPGGKHTDRPGSFPTNYGDTQSTFTRYSASIIPTSGERGEEHRATIGERTGGDHVISRSGSVHDGAGRSSPCGDPLFRIGGSVASLQAPPLGAGHHGEAADRLLNLNTQYPAPAARTPRSPPSTLPRLSDPHPPGLLIDCKYPRSAAGGNGRRRTGGFIGEK